MPIKICPRCGEQFIVSFDTLDYIHICNSGRKVLDEEDVVRIGDWEDYDGEGTISKQVVTMQGIRDETKPVHKTTKRGLTKATHRQRQHLQFINLKNGGLD